MNSESLSDTSWKMYAIGILMLIFGKYLRSRFWQVSLRIAWLVQYRDCIGFYNHLNCQAEA